MARISSALPAAEPAEQEVPAWRVVEQHQEELGKTRLRARIPTIGGLWRIMPAQTLTAEKPAVAAR